MLDQVGELVLSDLPRGEIAAKLLALLVSHPEDAPHLAELAGHFCPDNEYWRMLPFLLNRSLPPACQEVLMADLLVRPDAVRLPALYRLANDTTHPLCGEARQHLFAAFPAIPPNDMSALGRALQNQEAGRSPAGSK